MIARPAAVVLLLAPVVGAQSTADIRKAAAKALPVLERSAASFVAQRSCVSCHHNFLPILTLHMARERGFAVDQRVLSAVEEKTFKALRGPSALDDAVQATTLNDPTPNDSFLLMAASTAGLAKAAIFLVIAAIAPGDGSQPNMPASASRALSLDRNWPCHR